MSVTVTWLLSHAVLLTNSDTLKQFNKCFSFYEKTMVHSWRGVEEVK